MQVISQANAFDPKYPADAAYVENVPIIFAMAVNAMRYGKPVLSIDPRAAWENASTPTSWGPFSWQRKTQAQLTP
jgi:hypothetical protein